MGELDARGRRAIAVDLPAPDPAAGLVEYADAIEAAVAGEDDVVLVGHSFGGLSIPLVAARRPVRHLVYLCAVLAKPGVSLRDDEPFRVEGVDLGTLDHPDGTTSVDPERARVHFYNACAPEVADAAVRLLRRQSTRPRSEPCPLDELPGVERTSIICRREQMVSPDWSRRASRERLGVEAIELDGDHSPMLSCTSELADLLGRLA